MSVIQKLAKIQQELKAPKGQFNSFGKYKYRSAEDILDAAKPILAENQCTIFITDELVMIGERYYVKANVTFIDLEVENNGFNNVMDKISTTAYAREDEKKSGMDGSQITGSSSSYARKYALNALFLIDDTKDMDTDESEEERRNRAKKEAEERKKAEAAKKKAEKANQQPDFVGELGGHIESLEGLWEWQGDELYLKTNTMGLVRAKEMLPEQLSAFLKSKYYKPIYKDIRAIIEWRNAQ